MKPSNLTLAGLTIALVVVAAPASAAKRCNSLLDTDAESHRGVGDGTNGAPFEIWTAEHLWSMAHTPADYDKNFVQCAPIDLDGFYNESRPYFRVGDRIGENGEAEGFTGSYNGRNNSISNFVYDESGPYAPDEYALPNQHSAKRSVGIFSWLDCGSTVKKLNIFGAKIVVSGDTHGAGILAGMNRCSDANRSNLSTLKRIRVEGSIESTAEFTGGLVGDVNVYPASRTALTKISTVVSIKSKAAGTTGGLAGLLNNGDVSRAQVRVTITDVRNDHYLQATGGAIGTAAYSEIENSTAYAVISGSGRIGGFIGKTERCVLTTTLAQGAITAQNLDQSSGYLHSYGGFVGRTNDTQFSLSVADVQVNIISSAAEQAGAQTVKELFAGGFAGEIRRYEMRGRNIIVENSYATGDVISDLNVVDDAYSMGGFVGLMRVNGGDVEGIKNSYASGDVVSPGYAGGFIGDAILKHYPGDEYSYEDLNVSGSFAAGIARGAVRSQAFGAEYEYDNNFYVDAAAGADVGPGTPIAIEMLRNPNSNLGLDWAKGRDGWRFTNWSLPQLSASPETQ